MVKSRKGQKPLSGFTLVEVIVVLVILAILAAILVPKLTGFITEAKEKEAETAFHYVLSALMATNAEVDIRDLSADSLLYPIADGAATESDRIFASKIESYLGDDYKDKVWIMGTVKLSTFNNFAEALDAGAIVIYYYPDYPKYTPYYLYAAGEITKED
ncbi:MAG: prepilin-type N-terminal cleavage/methylation domain-containing protein [Bacillota bacterium]|nr:prepilin-type N-terminal cleavage/methylation domain-containing protein [Bacillota bacterium]